MNIIIYGIDEADFRCGGCIEAKRLLDSVNLPYEFKRIVTRNDDFPAYDKELMAELATKIKFTVLLLPYIFIDGELVKISKLKEYLENKGYEIDD